MSKKDFRIYCDEEYIEHLKTIADAQDTSLNQLVLSVLTKKYPMPKKKKQPQSPILDVEATRKHYEEIDKYLNEAATGGAKIKPYHLYLHLMEERDRLKKILDDIDQK